MPDRYCLIAALGLSPAVLTETVWSLWQDEGLVPAEVHLLTTRVGWARLYADLLGYSASATGALSLGASTYPARPEAPWAVLCSDVLGLPEVVPVTPHLALGAGGQPLPDLRSATDDLAFGAVCYALVRARTASRAAPPVVGSIAGGRKTMSAHLTTAFALWARPQDRLVHVLIDPPAYERQPVYWPTAATPDLRVDRVDVPFPRVRGFVERQFTSVLGARADLASLLSALASYDAQASPARVRVTLCQRHPARCPVALLSADGTVLAEHRFTPRMIGLLLVLADATAENRATHPAHPFGAVLHARTMEVPHEGGGRRAVEEGPLIDDDRTEAQLQAVYRWCGRWHLARKPQRWLDGRAVTDAVSRYHNRDGLGAEDQVDANGVVTRSGVPVLMQERLRFVSTKGHVLQGRGVKGIAHPSSRYWHWASVRALPIEVVAPDGPPENPAWPFRHIPAPVVG